MIDLFSHETAHEDIQKVTEKLLGGRAIIIIGLRYHYHLLSTLLTSVIGLIHYLPGVDRADLILFFALSNSWYTFNACFMTESLSALIFLLLFSMILS